MTGGTLGEFFSSLSFASALVAMFSLLLAEREQGVERRSWEKLGLTSFGLHALSVLGIIVTLFALIYTHRYEYHYVWAHSSNELPVYYMISCFWEGQEGSFLLWCFWHSVLGMILMRTLRKSPWRNLVLAVVASVELILSSMVLGIYIGESWVYGIYLLMSVVPAAFLAYRWRQDRHKLPWQEAFPLSGVILAVLTLAVVLKGEAGFGDPWAIGSLFSSFDSFVFGLLVFALLAYLGYYLAYASRATAQLNRHIGELLAGASILIAAFSVMFFDISTWKVGSTPFVMLKDVFPDNPAFLQNPDFVPTNGNGLNSLLQNYWMVIHPPTLFLGFASTVIPFAFVVAGLIKGKYREWIRPATPWALFSVMILGVGIIMGGYWAYETLNFGGYWNWDPVENGSLVPWLCGVASLHAMLVHKKTKAYLKLTMILVTGTFLLVLYSTFLTRSGILGDTSVHTFTDLGLSGQLLLLLCLYFAGIVVLMAVRWRQIPERPDESKVWSAEFLLFMGILVFVFASLEILLSTSLPVFNKIFGTNMAPPGNVQLFYYKWNVWFAVAFGVLSGIGQFLWWSKAKKKSPDQALFRPFLLAMVSGCAVLVALIWQQKDFAYDATFAKLVAEGALPSGFFAKILTYIEYGVMSVADELLLFSSLFVVLANTDILISLLKSQKKGLKVMGGTVTHIGFGLMLIGMLFSSGYDETISVNLTPDELAGFSEEEKMDNVRVLKNRPRIIKDYEVTYLGKKEAIAPIRSLEVIEEAPEFFKVRFKDSTGDRFGFVLPRQVFLQKEGEEEEVKSHAISDVVGVSQELEGQLDMQYVEDFLNKNIPYLNPPHINNRKLYGLKFRSLNDTSDQFVLYPEAEVNEEMQSIIAHPARRIYPDKDIYVHVSQIPADEEEEPDYKFHDLALKPGDTTFVGKTKLYFHNVVNLSEREELKNNFEVALAAHLLAIAGQDTFFANPMYFIAKDNTFSMKEANIEQLHLDFAFFKVDPKTGLFHFQVRQLTNPKSEFIAFKAISKPYINLLWLGTFILTFGFLLAIYRRFKES
jgi:cytochrome c-type biogenesis protein CcmF